MMKKAMILGVSTVLLTVMVGCSQQAVEKPITQSKDSTEVSTDTTKSEDSSVEKETANSAQTSENVKIATVEEIVEVYQKENPETDITSVELENTRSGFVYKVEGVDDELEYEMKINGETKEIIRSKNEKLDRDERDGIKREKDKLDLTDLISLDKATEIAEKEVGSGEAVEWDLDRELNVTYWEVTVKDGHQETQVKMDAKSGDVLEVELDD